MEVQKDHIMQPTGSLGDVLLTLLSDFKKKFSQKTFDEGPVRGSYFSNTTTASSVVLDTELSTVSPESKASAKKMQKGNPEAINALMVPKDTEASSHSTMKKKRSTEKLRLDVKKLVMGQFLLPPSGASTPVVS